MGMLSDLLDKCALCDFDLIKKWLNGLHHCLIARSCEMEFRKLWALQAR